MKQPVFLRVYLNGKLENVKQFTDEQIVIGRNSDIQLTLSSDSVSPLHALIEERDSGYYISDLGSQLGTFRNGQKIFDEPIETGDEITIGPYKIEFFIGVPKPKQSPTLTPVPSVAEAPKPQAVPPPPKSLETTEDVAVPPPTTVTTRSTRQREEPRPSFSSKRTFAPPSVAHDLSETLKTSKGPIVQVVVAWKERILGTYHFSEARTITIGADEKCDIMVPLVGAARLNHTLLKLGPSVRVCLTPEMTGDYFRDGSRLPLADLKRLNRMVQVDSGFECDLLQGEMLRLGLQGDLLNIYIRYVPEVPKPLVAPILDLSTSETAAVIMSVLVTAFFGLYMLIYTPSQMPGEENLLEEPLRKATIIFNVPKKEVIKVEEAPKTEKKVVQVVDKKSQQAQTTNPDPGRAGNPRPSERQARKGEVVSAIKQGGAIKTGKDGANMKTKDVTASGLLSVFGAKGTQKELSKATSGAGELVGVAESATGAAGSSVERAGESLGGRLKNVGGGTGTSTVGIAGVGTRGKGTGPFGSGSGGLGQKGRADINIEGSGAEFTGTIDKEAIRRVIRENLRLFKYCYDQALRRNSDAYGKVEIQWDIEERGRATNVIVKSNSTGDAAFGRCVGDKIKGLTFPEPPPDQIARVVYPFVFAAQ